ncbi:MAG: NAD-dependent epimerase/dehydratase family protein [Myxococcota bacterium]
MDKPTILVVGATGFLGAHVVRALRNRGYPVRATRRRNSPTWHLDDVEVEWRLADLDEPASMGDAVAGCRGVVHAAGFYPSDGLAVGPAQMRGVSHLRHLFDAIRAEEVPRVVYVSSPATLGLGDSADDVLDETHFYTPGTVVNAYYESKQSMEAEVYRYVRDGMPASIVLPTAVFGPGDIKPTTGRFLVEVARGRMPAVLDATMNAVDVRDVANSVVNALERGRGGRRYILGGENSSVMDFTRRAAELAGVSPPRLAAPAGPVSRAARVIERIGRRTVGRLGIDVPPFVVGVDLMAYSRGVDDSRARAELEHQSRPIARTLEDAFAWFEEHDYLD